MEIRNRKTGEIITVDEFKRKHRNVSFQHPIKPDTLERFGYDPIMNGPGSRKYLDHMRSVFVMV